MVKFVLPLIGIMSRNLRYLRSLFTGYIITSGHFDNGYRTIDNFVFNFRSLGLLKWLLLENNSKTLSESTFGSKFILNLKNDRTVLKEIFPFLVFFLLFLQSHSLVRMM